MAVLLGTALSKRPAANPFGASRQQQPNSGVLGVIFADCNWESIHLFLE